MSNHEKHFINGNRTEQVLDALLQEPVDIVGVQTSDTQYDGKKGISYTRTHIGISPNDGADVSTLGATVLTGIDRVNRSHSQPNTDEPGHVQNGFITTFDRVNSRSFEVVTIELKPSTEVTL